MSKGIVARRHAVKRKPGGATQGQPAPTCAVEDVQAEEQAPRQNGQNGPQAA